MRIAALALLGVASLAGSRALAQSGAVVIRVTEAVSGQALPNAEVIDLDSSVRRFTNARGEARVVWPGEGRLRVRVRQLGFQFIERELTRPAGIAAVLTDTATFALHRVAFVLPQVFTRATNDCTTDHDSVSRILSASVLEQLRMSAERYEAFLKAYPFRVRVERRTVRLDSAGKPRQNRSVYHEGNAETWGERYRPGRVIDQTPLGFSAPLLFLPALADPVFWKHHCFAVRGVESLHETRVLRLDFSPASNVRTVDWAGSALVDSATSVLHRVEFRLDRIGSSDAPRRLEGYTTFRSPSPHIMVPDSTVAMWWRRDVPKDTGWGSPDVVQLLRVDRITYRKAKPPDHTDPRR